MAALAGERLAAPHRAGELEFNDIGYLERKNDYQGYFDLTYRTLEPWWMTRETTSGFQLNVRDAGRCPLVAGDRAHHQLDAAQLLVVLLRGRPVADATRTIARSATARRCSSRPAAERSPPSRLAPPADHVRLVRGGRTARIYRLRRLFPTNAQLTFRIRPELELTLLPTAVFDHGLRRYVGTDASLVVIGSPADYRFATQNANSAGLTVRAAYTFTPELSLQFYTQLFLASVHYSSFFVYPKTAFREQVPFTALMPAGGPSGSPDSEQATLNVNLVLR